MTTLLKTTQATRKILALTAMVVAGIFFVIILINIGKLIQAVFFPPPPTPATVAFGKLPAISFPSSTSAASYTYTINTLSGDLPVFPTKVNVYKILESQPDLLALDKAKAKVKQIGFTQNPITLSQVKYEWVSTEDLPKTVILNINTYDFFLTSNYLTNPSVEGGNNLPNQTDALSIVTNFMGSFGITPSDIDTNKTKTSLFSIENGTLIPATSFSKTQIIRIDLFQKDVNGLPIYYEKPSFSTMDFLVGGGPSQGQIVQANFMHKTITNTSATYPIKTAQQAFNELKKGNAYIASADFSQATISIRNVYLAYYISSSDQTFLMPIIVFQGDNGFFAYISAVTDEWVGK